MVRRRRHHLRRHRPGLLLFGGARGAGDDGARDVFVFSALDDAGSSSTTCDVIYDFVTGMASAADRINLLRIDANSNTAADDAFRWHVGAVGGHDVGFSGRRATCITT